MSFAVPTQRCNLCGKPLPRTDSFFARDEDGPNGFSESCKPCLKSKALKSTALRDFPGNDLSVATDRALMAQVAAGMSDDGGSSIPHVAEVYESMLAAFGGPAGFARQMVSTYLAATPGSSSRVRILGLVAKLAKDTTDSGKATIALHLMTDEELEQETTVRLVSALKQRPELLKDLLSKADLQKLGDR